MFHDSEAQSALAMKRAEKKAMLVGGDFDQGAAKIADFYVRRRDIFDAAGSQRGITSAAPAKCARRRRARPCARKRASRRSAIIRR